MIVGHRSFNENMSDRGLLVRYYEFHHCSMAWMVTDWIYVMDINLSDSLTTKGWIAMWGYWCFPVNKFQYFWASVWNVLMKQPYRHLERVYQKRTGGRRSPNSGRKPNRRIISSSWLVNSWESFKVSLRMLLQSLTAKHVSIDVVSIQPLANIIANSCGFTVSVQI